MTFPIVAIACHNNDLSSYCCNSVLQQLSRYMNGPIRCSSLMLQTEEHVKSKEKEEQRIQMNFSKKVLFVVVKVLKEFSGWCWVSNAPSDGL